MKKTKKASHEIEVKILDINPDEIRKKLRKAGAKKAFDGIIEARFYDFPDSRVKKAGNHVRLRKFGSKKVELTFKKLKSRKKYKHNEELDIVVPDFESMHRFLALVGLSNYKSYRKKRERYKLGSFQFEIDKYPKIPHFVEIEAKSKDEKKAKKELEKAVKLIGYTMGDTKPWNGFEVHKHYKKKM
jgi:adenylate cyclase class 2